MEKQTGRTLDLSVPKRAMIPQQWWQPSAQSAADSAGPFFSSSSDFVSSMLSLGAGQHLFVYLRWKTTMLLPFLRKFNSAGSLTAYNAFFTFCSFVPFLLLLPPFTYLPTLPNENFYDIDTDKSSYPISVREMKANPAWLISLAMPGSLAFTWQEPLPSSSYISHATSELTSSQREFAVCISSLPTSSN